MDRFFHASQPPGGGGLDQRAGDDDRDFAQRIGAKTTRPTFTQMTGILTQITEIGPFWDDPTRMLKAQLVEPGAMGYWCTGGGSDTFTCGMSERAMNELLDRALVPAQDVLERFIDEEASRQIDQAISRLSVGELFSSAARVLGPGMQSLLGEQGPIVSLLVGSSPQQLGDFLESRIGPQLRGLVQSLVHTLTDRVLTKLRTWLRGLLREILREALVAACVGVPVVTTAVLLDGLRDQLRNRTRRVLPELVTTAATALVADLLARMVTELQAITRELERTLAWLADTVLRVLAVLAVLVVVAAAIVLGVLAVIAIFDPVPGDEIALGAGATAVARLVPILLDFIRTGAAVGGASSAPGWAAARLVPSFR